MCVCVCVCVCVDRHGKTESSTLISLLSAILRT